MLGASGGSGFFFLIIIAFIFIWFMVIRPQKKRQIEAARMANTLDVGDQVVTAGGIYGEVTSILEDDVMLRIAPETEVRVARKAIGAIIRPEDEPTAAEEPESAPEDAEPAAEAHPETEPHEPAGA